MHRLAVSGIAVAIPPGGGSSTTHWCRMRFGHTRGTPPPCTFTWLRTKPVSLFLEVVQESGCALKPPRCCTSCRRMRSHHPNLSTVAPHATMTGHYLRGTASAAQWLTGSRVMEVRFTNDQREHLACESLTTSHRM